MERATLGYGIIFVTGAMLGGWEGYAGKLANSLGLHTLGGVVLGICLGVPVAMLWKLLVTLAEL